MIVIIRTEVFRISFFSCMCVLHKKESHTGLKCVCMVFLWKAKGGGGMGRSAFNSPGLNIDILEWLISKRACPTV